MSGKKRRDAGFDAAAGEAPDDVVGDEEGEVREAVWGEASGHACEGLR